MRSDSMATLVLVSAGADFRRRRDALRLSQRELAEATGISRGAIHKVEHDDPSVSPGMVDRLRRELEQLERRYGVNNPDEVIQVLELEDGTRVTYTGTPQGVAEAAAEFLRKRAAGGSR